MANRKRDLSKSPADPKNSRGCRMTIKRRDIDPAPFNDIIEEMKYPVHLEFDGSGSVIYWEKDDDRKTEGKKMVAKAPEKTEVKEEKKEETAATKA